MTSRRTTALIFASLLGALIGTSANAQAYCALRDPVGSIYDLLPEADNYQSIVKVVGNTAKRTLYEDLNMDLHFNELGKHTLYVVTRDERPIAVVHARSESDRWGLTEIVWAFDLDLRVIDFRFQRCRNSARRELEQSDYRKRIQGQSYGEIRARWATTPTLGSTNEDSSQLKDLKALVTRSALKTLLVTEVVWGNDLERLRTEAQLGEHFKDPVVLDPMASPYTDSAIDQLARHALGEETGIVRDTVAMFRVHSQTSTVGFLVEADWQSVDTRARIRWLLHPTGRILSAMLSNGMGNEELAQTLRALSGFEPNLTSQCANSIELSALELGVLARLHGSE